MFHVAGIVNGDSHAKPSLPRRNVHVADRDSIPISFGYTPGVLDAPGRSSGLWRYFPSNIRLRLTPRNKFLPFNPVFSTFQPRSVLFADQVLRSTITNL